MVPLMLPDDEVMSFGDYVFIRSSNVLMRGIKVIELPSKQLQVLAVLLRAPGKVISRDSFFQTIWQDIAVEDHNLTQTIFMLRKSLGSLSDGSPYIETVSRKGYRLAEAALRPQLVVTHLESGHMQDRRDDQYSWRRRLDRLHSASRLLSSWLTGVWRPRYRAKNASLDNTMEEVT